MNLRILLSACLTILGWLQTSEATGQPNILLIVSEDNGPELGCYGDPYARTPNLDRLASEGVRFENACVPFSVCSPSRACFLTGLHSHENGHIGLATHKFSLYREDTPNVVTLLKPAGYHTGIIGKLHVNPASVFPLRFQGDPRREFQQETERGGLRCGGGEVFGPGGKETVVSLGQLSGCSPAVSQKGRRTPGESPDGIRREDAAVGRRGIRLAARGDG